MQFLIHYFEILPNKSVKNHLKKQKKKNYFFYLIFKKEATYLNKYVFIFLPLQNIFKICF